MRVLFSAVLVLASMTEADTVHTRVTRFMTADSAIVVRPAYRSVLDAPSVDYAIEPRCPIRRAELYVCYYPATVETLARRASPPYAATWNMAAIGEQDQLSLYFGYTLFHTNGDTIVSPPLVNRWAVDRRKPPSSKRAVCRQLAPKREIGIDGKSGDWKGFRRRPIGHHAAFACTWTPAAFYILVDVRDGDVTVWDRVETHFDLRRTRTALAGAEHRLISFGPKSRSFSTAVALTDSGPAQLDSIIVRISDEMDWRCGVRPDGYTIEARIPFCVLSDLEFPPAKFGFDVAVLDKRDDRRSRLTAATWSGVSPAARHSPAHWATIALRQVMLPLKITLVGLLAAVFAVILLILAILVHQKHKERYYQKLARRPLPPAARKALECIDVHCAEPDFSLGAAARKLGESEAELKRTLKAEAGAAFEDLVALARTRKAKNLLRTTAQPVNEIAAACGFAQTAAFAATFKRIAGIAPEQYRASRLQEALEEAVDAEEED